MKYKHTLESKTCIYFSYFCVNKSFIPKSIFYIVNIIIYLIVLDKPSNEEAANSSSEQEEVEEFGMEKIRKYLTQKLKLFDSSSYDEQSQQKVLRELSIDGIIDYIKENENCKIITMAGAGISTCEFL